ncbi:WNT1-inducible-signaling pathway protein 1 isoform X3 [Rhinatrema bivittatum]|uniref:WNT1-inducible-signaling pathway protein 1 isoform X3 n=1 Tax=Rhinatrema bivittatum TaxID=194408 RepID=UPI00112C9631|nr:WNT1-inducible-signaling pathway protein 1 isoform X3 [Rhinatrema bivittatum]
MRWLLPWVLAAGLLPQVTAQGIATPPPATDVTDNYNRTQYCKWPCECPEFLPGCPVGVSLIMDGCDCCKACAKQLGDKCTEADTCDPHKGLYCDYSRDRPRYEIGVCAPLVGMGCILNDAKYSNGETFQPNCKYNCTCINGAIGCVSMCTSSRPPLVWCQNPKRVKMAGMCCEQWICDDSRRIRKASPRHVPSSGGENESWHKNCIGQTSPWSPCSKTCGMGISTRISNDNEECRLSKERRICNLRPCEVDITKHIKVQTLASRYQVVSGIVCKELQKVLAWEAVLGSLQTRRASELHSVWVHEQGLVQAEILRCVHGRPVLHPVQIQDHRGELPVPGRQRLLPERDVD